MDWTLGKKVKIAAYIITNIGVVICSLYLLYFILKLVGDQNPFLLLIPVGILTSLAAAYGTFVGIKAYYSGKSPDFSSLFDVKKSDEKLVFWLFAPIMVPVFSIVYSIPFSVITPIFVYPIAKILNLQNIEALIAERVNLFLCLIFAIFTVIYLWRMFKNHRNNSKKKENV